MDQPFYIQVRNHENSQILKISRYIFHEKLVTGNPILCNCNLRPLQRWISSQLRVNDEWKSLSCIDYENSSNKSIYGLPEEEMPCDTFTLDQNHDFQLTPDVKFREITRYVSYFSGTSMTNSLSILVIFISRTKDGTLIISWYVPKNKEDIANFLLEIVNKTNPEQIFYKKNLLYDSRNEIVKPRFAITVIITASTDKRAVVTYCSDNIVFLLQKEAEICIAAITSNGTLRRMVPSQCQNLATVLPYVSNDCISINSQFALSFFLPFILYCIFRTC